MATVDASVAGTAHGTLTANTAEVITLAAAGTHRGQIDVQNRGTTVMYGEYGVTDLTIAGQGTQAVSPGETVTFAGDTAVAAVICLKSTGTPDYSVSRFILPREATVGGGAGGAVTSTVELGATSLAALESVTVDTEFPAAAALSDTTANPTAPMMGAALMYWDGTQWVRWQRNVKTLTVSSATLANVSASASSTQVFASNANARLRTVHNDSTAALYLKFGATASTTSYTVRLDADAYYEFPTPLYTGAVDGIWASATGSARTTEA